MDGLTSERPAARRRRSRVLTLSVSGVLVATSLAACGSGGDDAEEYRGVCVDQRSQQRVDDDRCDDGDVRGGYGWAYFRGGSRAPAVGERVSGATTSVPQGATATRGGVPGDGATVSRGGFGGGSDSSVGG